MRKVQSELSVPDGFRVAMIVTKAPSEPLDVVQKTILGMLAQDYPHDNWVADEDPTEEALLWYKRHNVQVSCRKDVPGYHNDTWPRRKKCKEGNLAYFYDHYGYEKYDIVAQLDADHIPDPDYLSNMVRPFHNKKVGYVSAPSVCDGNFDNSWSSRARGYSESMFHGPIQSGANDDWVPLCIGSHYTVRTQALKEIGGIGPELAEDYSTTLMMNANGWKGVWSGDAKATGIGPNNFADLIIQDYQWAKSLFTLMLTFFPKYWGKLTPKQKFQFVFTQLWYPVSALAWLLSILVSFVALVTGVPPVHVDFSEFLNYFLPQVFVSYLIFSYIYFKKHLRPVDIKIFSWENALFELARWPWVLLACLSALHVKISGSKPVARVTPKKKSHFDIVNIRTLSPYIFIVGFCLFSIYIYQLRGNDDVIGYFWFTVITAVSYTLLILFAVILHIWEAEGHKIKQVHLHLPQFGTVAILGFIIGFFSWLPLSSFYTEHIPNALSFKYLDVEEVETSEYILPEISASDFEYFPNESIEFIHVVTRGESLWSIAETYYGDGTKWKLIITPRNSWRIEIGDVVFLPRISQ